MKPMKKILALLLAVCMLIGMPFAVSAATEDTEQPYVVSAVVEDANDANGVNLLVTFSKPVTRGSASGHVYLCDKYNPDPNNQVTVNGVTYTSWQKSPSNLTYVEGAEGADGKMYSNQIRFTFPSPGTPLPSTAGIRFVEYNDRSEWNNGEVWSDVIAAENGLGLVPTIQDGSVDVSWTTVSIAEEAQRVVSAYPVSATTVNVKFAMMVKAIDPAGITVGDAAVTAAERVGGDANGSDLWSLTLNRALAEEDMILTMPANTITMAYNGAMVTKALTCSTDLWVDYEETADVIPLQNKSYNFMNTDTGRSITLKDGRFTVDAFTVVRKDANSNLIALKYGQQYLDLNAETVALVDAPMYYLLKACANERYQLLVNPDNLIIDTDAGTDNLATLGTSPATNTNIATGWYITASGDPRPLKLMPLGDSLTEGVNRDLVSGEPMIGYRENLSQELTKYFGRIVFVGAKKSAATTINETRLLRHAGYSGYVVKQIWEENTAAETKDHPGIDPFINDLTTKYAPDIVCLLLGHNDNTQMNWNQAHTGKTKVELIEEWLVEYEAFVRKIEATLGENGTIFCSSLTINRDAGGTESKREVNEYLIPLINELIEEGLKVAHADAWLATEKVGADGINGGDNVHLNATGYAALAEEWKRVITATYGANGVIGDATRFFQAQLSQAQPGDTVTMNADYVLTSKNYVTIPAGVTLDLNGHDLTVNNLISFGHVIDSKEGEGGLIIDKEAFTFLQPTNEALPLYDVEFGGYRFVSCTVTNKTPRTGEDYARFGINIKLGSEKGYQLLADAANADVGLSARVAMTDRLTLIFNFNESLLTEYAQTMLKGEIKEDNLVVYLTVWGVNDLSSGSAITLTPNMTSGTRAVINGGAQTYTKPAA